MWLVVIYHVFFHNSLPSWRAWPLALEMSCRMFTIMPVAFDWIQTCMPVGRYALAFWTLGVAARMRNGLHVNQPCCKSLSRSRAWFWMQSLTLMNQDMKSQLANLEGKGNPLLTMRIHFCYPARRCCTHYGGHQRYDWDPVCLNRVWVLESDTT